LLRVQGKIKFQTIKEEVICLLQAVFRLIYEKEILSEECLLRVFPMKELDLSKDQNHITGTNLFHKIFKIHYRMLTSQVVNQMPIYKGLIQLTSRMILKNQPLQIKKNLNHSSIR
jgi:hypothetical protein